MLVRRLDKAARWPTEDDPNPFLRYRTLLAAHARAEDDAQYVDVVRRLDGSVAEVDGKGFSATPLRFFDDLDVWVKDETGNVGGSHKGRHLMGLAIWLDVVSMDHERPLAIASCGNAAIAASVIARAAGRPLTVYVPTWADDSVVSRLRDRGAAIEVCPRRDDDPPGDPCVHRFREAVAAGAIPFSCQGPDNGLTIDGGRTLAYELVDAGLVVDEVVVQVGGGALASSVSQGFAEATALGRLAVPPRLHVVQAEAQAPMVRAWQRRRPAWRAHRSELMWPWEPPGTSVATGILDDEAYDWAAVLDGLEGTGGTAVTVTEDDLLRAHTRAHDVTGLDVSPTGSAGLAGFVALRDAGTIAPTSSAAVLFTG
ncbi:MAG TPA: pyridoxal-phosphate dependent enzyme [Acidimicrobiales bacterium]|nr:pyridoxal-phosphate dependent enzyme [Acidimicrobiales bacterium]